MLLLPAQEQRRHERVRNGFLVDEPVLLAQLQRLLEVVDGQVPLGAGQAVARAQQQVLVAKGVGTEGGPVLVVGERVRDVGVLAHLQRGERAVKVDLRDKVGAGDVAEQLVRLLGVVQAAGRNRCCGRGGGP